jgi:hypothetical protein
VKKRLISTTFAALAGVGLVTTVAACGALGGGQIATAEVGDCVDSSQMDDTNVTEIPTVDCTEAHDAQVVGKFDLEDGDYPGTDAIATEADAGCTEAFEDFIGVAADQSSLQISYVYPTEQSWDQADDREILCFAIGEAGTTESWEGSGV